MSSLYTLESSPTQGDELFVIHAYVFALNETHYGCLGKVISYDNGEIIVKLVVRKELKIDKEKYLASLCQNAYMPATVAVDGKQINALMFSKITNALHLVQKSGEMYNVGLNLKSNKMAEERLGYAKKSNSSWLYSDQTVHLVDNYVTKYPQLFSYLDSCVNNDYNLENTYPNLETLKLDEIKSWIYRQKHNKVTRVVTGSEFLPVEAVVELERDIRKAYIVEKVVNIKAPPETFFWVTPTMDPSSPLVQQHFIMDRIVTCRPSVQVPLGCYGFIIGIYKNHEPSQNLFIILFDKPFSGGMSLLGSDSQSCYMLFDDSFINVSDGIRKLSKGYNPTDFLRQHKKKNTVQLSTPTVALRMASQPKSNVAKLLKCFEGMGIPQFWTQTLSNGLVVADVGLPDGLIYRGSPCGTKEEACELVAYQACSALGFVQKHFEEDESTFDDHHFLSVNQSPPVFSPVNNSQLVPPSELHAPPSHLVPPTQHEMHNRDSTGRPLPVHLPQAASSPYLTPTPMPPLIPGYWIKKPKYPQQPPNE